MQTQSTPVLAETGPIPATTLTRRRLLRASLLDAGVVGTPLTLSGQVVSTKGQPINHASAA